MKEIYKKLINTKSVALFTHCNADLDAYGSVGAFYHWLKSIGKQVKIFLCEPINPKFNVLKLQDIYYEENTDFDLALCVDCSSVDRMEKFAPLYKSKQNLLIDHHKKDKVFYDYAYIDSQSPATCDIIFDFFKTNNIQITPVIATCIYVGIMGDTGCLMHDSTNSAVFNKVAQLIELGCDRISVKEKILNSKALAEIKSYETIIKSLQINQNIAFTTFTLKDKKSLNITENIDTGTILNLILHVEQISVSVIFKQSKKNVWRVSMRAKNGYDLTDIAIEFGGGGHKQAAGFNYIGNLNKLKKDLLQKLTTLKGEM